MTFLNPFKKQIIEHPKFTEGKLAFSNGRELSDNPYETDTEDFCKWECGWKVAFQARKIFEERGNTIKSTSYCKLLTPILIFMK